MIEVKEFGVVHENRRVLLVVIAVLEVPHGTEVSAPCHDDISRQSR